MRLQKFGDLVQHEMIWKLCSAGAMVKIQNERNMQGEIQKKLSESRKKVGISEERQGAERKQYDCFPHLSSSWHPRPF
jgi:hypothetical protein